MPSKRHILEQLKRDELIAAIELFELPVADWRDAPAKKAARAAAPPRREAAPAPSRPTAARTTAARTAASSAGSRKLTLRQLERHLFAAANILRGKMAARSRTAGCGRSAR